MAIVDDGGYGESAPKIRHYLERFEVVLDRVRTTHCGRPTNEVMIALEMEAAAEGIEVWKEILEDAARVISESDSKD